MKNANKQSSSALNAIAQGTTDFVAYGYGQHLNELVSEAQEDGVITSDEHRAIERATELRDGQLAFNRAIETRGSRFTPDILDPSLPARNGHHHQSSASRPDGFDGNTRPGFEFNHLSARSEDIKNGHQEDSPSRNAFSPSNPSTDLDPRSAIDFASGGNSWRSSSDSAAARSAHVGEGVGPGSGGRGTEENHSLPSETGYSQRGFNDLDGPEANAGAWQADSQHDSAVRAGRMAAARVELEILTAQVRAADLADQRDERQKEQGVFNLEGPEATQDQDDNQSESEKGLDKPGSKSGPKPIVLDLDGNGISVTELSQSAHYVDGGDGLKHRTAWAAAGDGVLFFDVSGDGQINEKREYVFTDWDPTATSDLEALRSVFDTNNDGKLTAADSTFASFKVMVTKADGTTEAKTLTQLGITENDLNTESAGRCQFDDLIASRATTKCLQSCKFGKEIGLGAVSVAFRTIPSSGIAI